MVTLKTAYISANSTLKYSRHTPSPTGLLTPWPPIYTCTMLARVHSCAVSGFDAVIVEFKVDYTHGVPGLTVVGLRDTTVLESRERITPTSPTQAESAPPVPPTDFGEIKEQEHIKRAIEVAAAGGHNILMSGSPGSGETLLARVLPGIIPEMSIEETLDVTRIYWIADQFPPEIPIIRLPLSVPRTTRLQCRYAPRRDPPALRPRRDLQRAGQERHGIDEPFRPRPPPHPETRPHHRQSGRERLHPARSPGGGLAIAAANEYYVDDGVIKRGSK